MMTFFIGYAAAIVTYLIVGLCIGLYFVTSNLARFHGGGFQWARMAKYVAIYVVGWPGAVTIAFVPEEL